MKLVKLLGDVRIYKIDNEELYFGWIEKKGTTNSNIGILSTADYIGKSLSDIERKILNK